MSLKSLFTLTLSLLLLIILSVVFTLNIKNIQHFLENQVYSTSQDTVYSLAMSLSKIDEKNSLEDVELVINSIFDSGYYEYIRYYDLNNNIIYEASLPVVVKDIPQWYIDLVPLNLSEATGNVNSSWSIKGSLSIKGHLGYAYYELYKNFKSLLAVFSIIALISIVALIIIINTLLFSLNRIKNQANSISEHKFIIEKESLFISEFNILTQAMNKMVAKVESIFKSEVETFQHYQDILYRDDETALPNKKYFMLKLKEILEDDSKNIGYLAIISIDGLEKIKKENSYELYKKSLDKFIMSIPKALRSNNLLSRISENELAILFNTHNLNEIQNYFDDLQTAFNLSTSEVKTREKLLCFNVGVAPYLVNDQVNEALSRVDYALSRSKLHGCNIIDIYKNNDHAKKLIMLGKNSWKEIFNKIFSENRIVLASQSTLNSETDTIFHDEFLLRIREEDHSLHSAAFYLPMANTLGLISKFDNVVIKQVLQNINTYSNAVAINISSDFVLKSLYFLELRNRLSKLRLSNPATLHFESSENDILQELDSFIEFSEMIHAHNQLFGIDRFTGIDNIGYIERLRPDYIKINVNFILESFESNRAIVKTLDVLSKTMGIILIITAVENKEQLNRLKKIGYENFQGRYISDIKV